MNRPLFRRSAAIALGTLLAVLAGCTDGAAPDTPTSAAQPSPNIRLGGLSIKITDGPSSLAVGQQAMYTAVATDIFGRALPPSAIIWISNRPGIVRMNGNVATALRPGTATISAVFFGGIDQRQVTVSIAPPPQPTRIELTYYLRSDTTDRPSLINSDGTQEQLFPMFDQGYHQFDLAPDRSRLAFTKAFDNRLFTSAADGTDLQVLVSSGVSFVSKWSPDGRQIVWVKQAGLGTGGAGREVFRMTADGTNQTQLTFNGSEDNSPSFSPDQTRILFQSNRSGSFEIWVMDVDGANPRPLTASGDYKTAPTWSPDGSRIAFVSTRSGMAQVYDMAADGTGIRQLTNLTDLSGLAPVVYAPDGLRMAIGRVSSGQTSAWLMNVDGSSLTQFRIPDSSRSAEFIESWRR